MCVCVCVCVCFRFFGLSAWLHLRIHNLVLIKNIQGHLISDQISKGSHLSNNHFQNRTFPLHLEVGTECCMIKQKSDFIFVIGHNKEAFRIVQGCV